LGGFGGSDARGKAGASVQSAATEKTVNLLTNKGGKVGKIGGKEQ